MFCLPKTAWPPTSHITWQDRPLDIPRRAVRAAFQLLHDRWQRVQQGNGQAALISDVAGQGKTRLIAEFVRQVQAAAWVLAGHPQAHSKRGATGGRERGRHRAVPHRARQP